MSVEKVWGPWVATKRVSPERGFEASSCCTRGHREVYTANFLAAGVAGGAS